MSSDVVKQLHVLVFLFGEKENLQLEVVSQHHTFYFHLK